MKKSSYLFCSLGVALIGALNSCTPAEEERIPVLGIEEDLIAVPAEGGEFSVRYSLENPVDGVLPSVVPEEGCDWVSDFTVSEGVISFTVAANENSGQRNVKVEVTYPQVSTGAEFTIEQEGTEPVPGDLSISIEVKDFDASSIVGVILHCDESFVYYLGIEKSEWLNDNDLNDNDAFFQYVLEDIEYEVAGGKSYGDVLYKGTLENMRFYNCVPETDYTIYAFGLDTVSKEMTTDITKVNVTTGAIEMTDVQFAIEVEENDGTLTITATPQEGYDGYFYIDIYDKFNMELFNDGMSLFERCDDSFRSIVEVYSMFLGWSVQDILENACYKGDKNVRLYENAMAEMEYTIVAYAVTNTGYANSDPSFVKFTTGPGAVSSDNRITVDVEKVSNNSATVSFGTTNDDAWFYYCQTADRHESMFGEYSNEDIMNYILFFYTPENEFYVGDRTVVMDNLEKGTEYYVYAFGVDMDREIFTTDLTVATFVTGESDAGASFSAEFGKYYNVQEILAIDPSWSDKIDSFEDYGVVMPVKVSTEPEGCEYYYGLFRTEYYSDWSDEDFYDMLAFYGPYKDPVVYCLSSYSDFDSMLVGACKDADGNWGPIERYDVAPFTEDGASDAQEFVDTYQ